MSFIIILTHITYYTGTDTLTIITLYNGNKRQCEMLLTHINKIHNNMAFTAEYENNNSINFLELTITKFEHRHKFNIYRKPITTDTEIHNSSNLLIQQKLSV